MNGGVVGSALGVACTAGFVASVAITTDSLLGNVAAGVATDEAHASDGHHSQLVGLGLSTRAGRDGQEGDGGDSAEKHVDLINCFSCGSEKMAEIDKSVTGYRQRSTCATG